MKPKPKQKVSKGAKSVKKSYHHGNLHETLIDTANKMISSAGFESFSLRACAKEAGVAHSAPGHYFKDVGEILTQVAIRAFVRLADRLVKARLSGSPEDPIYTICYEYIRFARDEPKIFYMIFHSDRIDRSSIDFQKAGELALRELVISLDPDLSKRSLNNEKILYAWSFIHGLAMLSIDGPMAPVGGNRKGLNSDKIESNLRILVDNMRKWNESI